ncbi:MAG: glycosyltransferase family 2 protein [Nostochopsis sp.]
MHQTEDMPGWQGLKSLTCLSETDEIYDIDVRYAWSEKIFQQHLVDYGWSEDILLDKKGGKKPYRHKLIIYLCESSTKINEKQKLEITSEHSLIGNYWRTVSHLYILLQGNNPFKSLISNHKICNNQESCFIDYEPVIKNSENSQIKTLSRLPPHPKRQGEGGLRTKGLYKNSASDKPLITVITVVFNGEKYLEQTIQSVINQSYPNLEYIILDGGSTDNTLEIIKKYEGKIDYWVSEPDLGVFDAMNKGFICAFGEFVNFMNVGDIFFQHKVIESLDFTSLENSICGINVFFSNLVPGLIRVEMYKQSIPHQAFFMKRKDFEINVFNTEFKYAADSELWERFNPLTSTIESREEIISLSRFGGISTNKKYLIDRMQEHLTFQQNKPKVWIRFLPKIIFIKFFNQSFIEYYYFVWRRKLRNISLKRMSEK